LQTVFAESKKSRRVKITFLGWAFAFDARDLVAQDLEE